MKGCRRENCEHFSDCLAVRRAFEDVSEIQVYLHVREGKDGKVGISFLAREEMNVENCLKHGQKGSGEN